MNREVCGQCDAPVDLCSCFILNHARWCNHCKFHVNVQTHAESCEFAALQKEVEHLRKENFRMKEILMASYAPRPWVRE